MKQAGMQEIRTKTADLLGGTEPFLVTKRGKVSGVYVPLPPGGVSDLKREIARALGSYLSAELDARGVSEEEIQSRLLSAPHF